MVSESWPHEHTLKDGRHVITRPIRADDAPGLIEAFRRLSFDTVYQRFFGPIREMSPRQAHYLTNVDYQERFAIVAEGENELVAVARYEPTEEKGVAEVAVVVGDCWQGNGLGRILMRELFRAAADNGIRRFRAEVLSTNRRMLYLLNRETRIEQRRNEGLVTRLIVSPLYMM
jgi:GNAT superfamily N-acetyltransferase